MWYSIKNIGSVIYRTYWVLSAETGNSQIGFEHALTCAGIEYVPNYLHYAKHDANYLYQLFLQCFQQYNRITVDETCFANETTRSCMQKTVDM